MERIHCLIVDIPHALLTDLIHKISAKCPEIKIMGQVNGKKELQDFINEHSTDVVMLGVEKGKEIEFFDGVFELTPQVSVVGIIDDGRRICVCVEDVGSEQFISLVKAAVKKKH